MGLIDLPTNWDFPSAHKQVVMQDERNFSRPREPFYQSTMPLDISYTNDSSVATLQIQKFMKTSPYGIAYAGPVDGISNPELIRAVRALEKALELKYPGNTFTGTIVTGNSISSSGLKNAIDLVKKLKSGIPAPANKSNVKLFQKYFGLPESGTVDMPLITAAKNAERLISEATGSSATGLLWDDSSKQFKTTVEDLDAALKLVRTKKK